MKSAWTHEAAHGSTFLHRLSKQANKIPKGSSAHFFFKLCHSSTWVWRCLKDCLQIGVCRCEGIMCVHQRLPGREIQVACKQAEAWPECGSWWLIRSLKSHSFALRGAGLRREFLILRKLHSAVDNVLLPFLKMTSFWLEKVCSITSAFRLSCHFQPKTSGSTPNAPDLTTGCLWENTLQRGIGGNSIKVAGINKLLVIVCSLQVGKRRSLPPWVWGDSWDQVETEHHPRPTRACPRSIRSSSTCEQELLGMSHTPPSASSAFWAPGDAWPLARLCLVSHLGCPQQFRHMTSNLAPQSPPAGPQCYTLHHPLDLPPALRELLPGQPLLTREGSLDLEGIEHRQHLESHCRSSIHSSSKCEQKQSDPSHTRPWASTAWNVPLDASPPEGPCPLEHQDGLTQHLLQASDLPPQSPPADP